MVLYIIYTTVIPVHERNVLDHRGASLTRDRRSLQEVLSKKIKQEKVSTQHCCSHMVASAAVAW